jgi:hypothetical protein
VTKRHDIVCGQGKAGENRAKGDPLALDLHGPEANVYLKLEDISEAMAAKVPDRLVDLLEIATYVYAADQAIGRGPTTDSGEKWRRGLDIRVPVRDQAFWSQPELLETLIEVLSFISDDDYSFGFTSLKSPPWIQQYLELGGTWHAKIDRVQLFSGGVDSFAGALHSTLVEKKNVALVSHRSVPKRVPKVTELMFEIARRASPRTVQPVTVWATKAESIGREYTQRTRSFLYSTLATIVASMLNLDRIFFFENGVTSINLPIAGQVVGGRATRTTHPQTIEGLAKLFSLILENPFEIEAPFLWHTKTNVMRVVKEVNCADLLAHTVSCSRTVGATKLPPHCGRCSQCIDRRFAALAANLGDSEDPPGIYEVDLLTGERAPGEDRAMLEGFVERARLVREADDTEFFTRFPDASRVLRHTGLNTDEATRHILDLHRRHGAEVEGVLSHGFKENAEAFHAGRLPDSCLLVLTVPKKYRSAPEDGDGSQGPTFVHEGDFWRVWFGNETSRLKDSIGMRYIALLLQSPGHEFHSTELIRLEAGTLPVQGWLKGDHPSRKLRGQVRRLPEGDGAGGATAPSSGLTDRMTIRGCRRRLEELEAESSGAHADGETDRELELKEESKSIQDYLRNVTGLGGLPRKASDENEKARKSVANAVIRALNHVDGRKHLPFWRHLRKHMKTGTFCVYSPDLPTRWVVSN